MCNIPNRPALAAIVLCILTQTLMASNAAAQETDPTSFPEYGNRASALVATTEHFAFHSDFWQGLHDFLYLRAQSGTVDTDDPPSLAELDADLVNAWHGANAFYITEMKDRDHLWDDLMRAMRFALADIKYAESEVSAEFEEVLGVLRAAAPAYAAAWWPEHDRRNRAWIAELLPLVEQHEGVMTERLARHYDHPWPEGLMPIDVVTYVSWSGADTMSDPKHVMISSDDPSLMGLAAFEIVFHESSHTIIGANSGAIAKCLDEAAGAHDRKPPRNLWHAILFVTEGEEARRVLAEAGHENYEPYIYKTGLFDRAWPSFHTPIDKHWPAYLDGDFDLCDAVRRIMDDIVEAED